MPSPSRSHNTPAPRPLIDRVRDRVEAAGITLANEASGSRAPNPQSRDEKQALRRVFREMGTAQRQSRRESGHPPFPVVRSAAIAFRRAPSLTSLTAVAASLDEVGLLGW